MQRAPLPTNEADRLAALYHYRILDSPGEGIFAALAMELRRTFNVPMAAITFLDETRQWFKAESGLAMKSVPREEGFCCHTILGTAPLVVEDASRDPRFVGNVHVTSGLGIRFYSGAPIIDRDGFAIGAVCIADSRVRTMSMEQVAKLNWFAKTAMRHVELHLLRLTKRADLLDFLAMQAEAARLQEDDASATHFIELVYAFFDETEYESRQADDPSALH